MISIAIVEDDKNAAEKVKHFTEKFFTEQNTEFSIDNFYDGEEFLTKFKNDYSLVLLDIEMPHINGMETARRLRSMNSDSIIVFITNLTQYAINGYEVNATGYLLKPVSYLQFKQTMLRVTNKLTSNKGVRLTLNVDRGIKVVSSNEIIYIETVAHGLVFHCHNEDVFTRKTLKDVELLLEEVGFVRCNHCYIVNLKFVVNVGKDSLTVIGDTELAISRTKKKDVMSKIMEYSRQ